MTAISDGGGGGYNAPGPPAPVPPLTGGPQIPVQGPQHGYGVGNNPYQSGSASPADWSSYLGMYGLPADVQRELNAIFARTPDVSQATQLALAYVRGTDWYRVTYPGIQEAIAKGIVKNEADYRAQMNAFNQVYRQYMNGQDLTAGQFAEYLREGVSLDTVGRRFQGAALVNTYGGDWQYLSGAFGDGRLEGNELKALGEQSAGLDSELGLRIQRRLQQAQERIRTVFSGTLATGKLAEPLAQRSGIPADIGR